MKKLFIFAAIAALVAWPLGASAATFKTGDNYSLGQNQSVTDDLYVGSGMISISGLVTGDLIAAGGNVSLTGRVVQDATVAGGSLTVSGAVGDDVRAAGGNVTIESAIGGDLFVAGGQVLLASGGVVNGDVIAAGGQITIDGRVNGNVNVSSGKVVLGSTAVINGNFTYKSGKEAEIASGARIVGTTLFNKIERIPGKSVIGPFIVFSVVAKTIIVLITALLLVGIFRTKAPKIVHHALNNFWSDSLRGFLTLVAVPVAIILLFITVVGIPFAVLLLLGYIALMILSGISSGVVFGSWLAKVLMKKDPAPVDWKTVIVGVLALGLISLIPAVGWIATFIFFLVAIGAMTKHWYENVWQNR